MTDAMKPRTYSISRMISFFFLLVFLAMVLLSVYYFGSFADILHETSRESFFAGAEKSASALKNDLAAAQTQIHQIISSAGSSQYWKTSSAYERMLYAKSMEGTLDSVLNVFDSAEAVLITQRSDNVIIQSHTMGEDAFLRLLDAYGGQGTTQPGAITMFSEDEKSPASHLILRESLAVYAPSDLHLRTHIYVVFAIRLDTLMGKPRGNETLCLCRERDGRLQVCSVQGAPGSALPEYLPKQETNAVLDYEGGGGEYLSACFGLDCPGLYLVCLQPQPLLLSDVGPVLWRGVVMTMGVLVLSIISIAVISKRIRRPIRQIADDVDIIRSGAYDYRLPIGRAKELARLSGGMNTLLNELDCRTKTLIETQKNLYELRILNRESEIMALQSQINPHFLYNTLECVRGIAQYYRVPEIVQIVSSMAGIYRYSAARPHIGTVGEEIECAARYAEIIDIRFGGLYSLDIQADGEVQGAAMPKMILQPLVENAVNHGLTLRPGKGVISLLCAREDGMIRIRVRDDGVGISKDRLRELRGRLAQGKATEHSGGASIGLANIHQRLRTEFGDACGLEIQSTENQYTEISFLLPFSVNTDGEAERS